MSQADSTNTTGAPGDDPGRQFATHLANLAAQERARQKALRRVFKLRQKASTEIDRLIAFLDACDPYVTTELEENCEDEAAQCEGEGEQCDDEGSESDKEPSLGSLDHRDSQELWAIGNRSDRELDDAESGIADQDGLDEQVPFRDWQNVGMV
jgi:hypothetical protein